MKSVISQSNGNTFDDRAEQSRIMASVPENIPHGDMPGDNVEIADAHISKAKIIFPELLRLLGPARENSACGRAVVAVCGGSGAGKTGIASLLSYYLQEAGIGSYTLSGDNYPLRIPQYNDAVLS